VAFLLFVWPALCAHIQSLALLDIVSGEKLSWLLQHTASGPVTTQNITLPGNIRARLYTPVDHPNAPGVVIFHGVHHLGIDEPRLMSLAQALSACGLRVLTPELPGIRDYHIDTSSIDVIGESTEWFAKQTRRPVGVMGLSFSGGLALIASTKPQYASYFRFIVAIGSQNSMNRVAQYYRTGRALRPDGTVEVLPPHEYGALVLEYEHLEDFVPVVDIPAIRDVLRAHLYEDVAAEKQAMEQLTTAQRNEALDLMNAHSAHTQFLLEHEEEIRGNEMAELSPAGKLSTLTTPVFLLHGEADNIIPSEETLWMTAELKPRTLRMQLISPIISHVGMENSAAPSWMRHASDEWQLVHFFALILRSAH
jgi:acetyl esterase/lipase